MHAIVIADNDVVLDPVDKREVVKQPETHCYGTFGDVDDLLDLVKLVQDESFIYVELSGLQVLAELHDELAVNLIVEAELPVLVPQSEEPLVSIQKVLEDEIDVD